MNESKRTLRSKIKEYRTHIKNQLLEEQQLIEASADPPSFLGNHDIGKLRFDWLTPASVRGGTGFITHVGAGLSTYLQRTDGSSMPTWKGLLTELSDAFSSAGVSEALSKESLTLEELQDIATKIRRSCLERSSDDDGDFRSYLAELLASDHMVPQYVHHLAARIPTKRFYTTNYDLALEGALALRNRGTIPHIITTHHRELDKYEGFCVVKLHGTVSDPPTMTLTVCDYGTEERQRLIDRFLRDCKKHHLLVLGSSGLDPHLDAALDMYKGRQSAILIGHLEVDEARWKQWHERGAQVWLYHQHRPWDHSGFVRVLRTLAEPQSTSFGVDDSRPATPVYILASVQDKDQTIAAIALRNAILWHQAEGDERPPRVRIYYHDARHSDLPHLAEYPSRADIERICQQGRVFIDLDQHGHVTAAIHRLLKARGCSNHRWVEAEVPSPAVGRPLMEFVDEYARRASECLQEVA
ncbi:MAG: SIR2 family protein [Myxococcota bacterium]